MVQPKFKYDIVFFNFHYQYLQTSFYNGDIKFINCYEDCKQNSLLEERYGKLICDSKINVD